LQEGYIFGCGAQGRVALDVLRSQYRQARWFFVDDNPAIKGKMINDVEVIGGLDVLKGRSDCHIHVALGRPELKRQITARCKSYGLTMLSAIHPSATISPGAQIGNGVFIGPGAIINTGVQIHDGVLINTGVIVEHDSIVENFANISPAVCVGGRVQINAMAFVGSGALLLARIEVGEGAVVGMGAVVNKSVPSNTLVYGVPARVIKTIDEDFNWSKVL